MAFFGCGQFCDRFHRYRGWRVYRYDHMSGAKHSVVAITGGNRGIGRAVADLFHSRGWAIGICSRSPKDHSLPIDLLHCRVDVRHRKDLFRFAAAVQDRFGGLDVFINSAGISRWQALEKIDETFSEEVIETNVLGTLWGCAAAADAMKKGGVIVNISSLAGKRGSTNNSVYCAAKFAVNGITQSLAKELGPRGIRVNAVCPTYVETERILMALSEPASPAYGQAVETYLSSFASTQTALGRLPTAEEVAETVYFLAGPAASAITGQCLNVDCGTLPQ